MTSRTLTVGAVQVTAVCDVDADFPDPLGDAFPSVEAAAWAPYRRSYPAVFDGPDRWRLRDWCFVVRAGDRVVLVDTGVGGPGTPGATWIGTPGRLPGELAAAGVELDEVDLVVLTHLHLDHVGWNLAWDGGSPRPLFPRARYLVQRADWEAFAARPEATRVAFDRCVRHPPGHTPGSQSLRIRSGAAAARLWGDVANHPAQVDRPDWGPASDALPEVASQTRRRLLDRLEAETMWLAPAHFPEPFGTVTRDPDGRHWTGRR